MRSAHHTKALEHAAAWENADFQVEHKTTQCLQRRQVPLRDERVKRGCFKSYCCVECCVVAKVSGAVKGSRVDGWNSFKTGVRCSVLKARCLATHLEDCAFVEVAC